MAKRTVFLGVSRVLGLCPAGGRAQISAPASMPAGRIHRKAFAIKMSLSKQTRLFLS